MTTNSHTVSDTYALVTAAHNEETYIESTITAVASQTILPTRWVIVSDASTDRTDDIVQSYARQCGFIQLLRYTTPHPRNFAAQVNAINIGVAQLTPLTYKYIGNVDADVSFGSGYYSQLLAKFQEDPGLGLCGGVILERDRGQYRSRRTNRTWSVAHAVQLFRRKCFEDIGGYVPLKYGGPDWHAEVTARMKGWDVRAFPDLEVFHHRPTGTADRLIGHCFRQGRMDHSVGSLALFELLKCLVRIPDRPFVVGALSRLAGFTWSAITRDDILVADEFVQFLRKAQRGRIVSWLSGTRWHSHVARQ